MYSLSDFSSRPTIDADYLLKNHTNNMDTLEKVVNEIIDQTTENEFIEFSIVGLREISEFSEYPGVRISLIGSIKRTRTPFTIDLGVGDIIIPSSVERSLPVLLPDFENPKVLTYSLESTVAEKLDAMVNLMEANSRMKDFYDIYYLATNFDFEGRDLQEAIHQTFSNREREFEKDTITIIDRLIGNPVIQQRWNNFCVKILKYELNINDVFSTIIDFTELPYQAIFENTKLTKKWSHIDKKYI